MERREPIDQSLKNLNIFGRSMYHDFIWQAGLKCGIDSKKGHNLIK